MRKLIDSFPSSIVGVSAVALLCTAAGTGLEGSRQVTAAPVARGGTVAGTIRDANGAPIGGVSIVLFPRDEARWASDQDARRTPEGTSGPGAYRLTDIPAGAYFVAALNGAMLREWPSAALLRRLTIRAFPVDVAAGQTITLNLTVEITGNDSGITRIARVGVVPIPTSAPPPGVAPPPGTAVISGRIVDTNNQPVPRLEVRAVRPLISNGVTTIGTFGRPSLTDQDGTYRIENLRAGRLLVVALSHVVSAGGPATTGPVSRYQMPAVASPSGLAYVTTLYPGVTSASEARAIELTDGLQVTANFVLQQRPVTTVSGGMSQGEGGVRLTLVPASPLDQIGGVGTQMAVSSDDGAFRFTGVSAGQYTIVGSSSLGWVQSPVTINPGVRQAITLELRPPLTVSGTVRFEGPPPPLTGRDAQPFLITLVGTGGPGASGSGVSIRSSGEFAVRVAPGSYRLLLNAPAPWQIVSVTAGGTDVTAGVLPVTSDMSGLVVTLRAGGR